MKRLRRSNLTEEFIMITYTKGRRDNIISPLIIYLNYKLETYSSTFTENLQYSRF